MSDFELKGTKVERVDFVNRVQANTKIELSNRYSYNVGYSADNTCTGEFKAEIFGKDFPEKFSLTVILRGYFTVSPGVPKERLHVKTYDALFPFVKAFVCSLTAACSIPPVYMPYVDISRQNIYRVEMPGKPDIPDIKGEYE